MKHKTWFRLVLKAIGILIIVLCLPNTIGVGWMLVAHVLQGGGTGVWETWPAGHVIGNLAAIAIGLFYSSAANGW